MLLSTNYTYCNLPYLLHQYIQLRICIPLLRHTSLSFIHVYTNQTYHRYHPYTCHSYMTLCSYMPSMHTLQYIPHKTFLYNSSMQGQKVSRSKTRLRDFKCNTLRIYTLCAHLIFAVCPSNTKIWLAAYISFMHSLCKWQPWVCC